MSIKTLVINPGSTSTKVAIYQDDKAVRELTLRHSTEELAPFAGVLDQFDFRKQIILDAMKEAGVTLSDIDAVIGRGGLIKPVKSGVYEVNETMIDDIRHRPVGNNNDNRLVRWWGFNRIEGSNDGTNFEVIAERVALTPDPNVYENLLTDNVAIPENDYRYLRFIGWNDVSTASPYLGFYCARGVANGGINPGGTIQINEIYLGREKK